MATHAGSADALWVHVPVAQQSSGIWVDDALREQARAAMLADRRGVPELAPRQRIEVLRGSDPEARLQALYYQRGWTDGLPVVAPTPGRVEEMLLCSPLARDTVIGELEPMNGVATVEKVAINAVLAGCRPEHFPIVLAAVEALLDPSFNLRGVQTTDENVAPLLIVSGPVVEEVGLNAGIGALGPGWRANAAIGRCLRLCMLNIGGGWPGVSSLAGIGQPARYTLCVAEQSGPWPALPVDAGYPAGANHLMLLRAESCINVTGELDDVASLMGSAASAFSLLHGGYVAVLIAPATAQRLAAQGWGKADVAKYLHEHGRIPRAQWDRMWVRNQIGTSYGLPLWVEAAAARGDVPVVEDASNILVFVAGGAATIAQHVYFPTWGFPPCRVVRSIALPAAWPELLRSNRDREYF